MFVITFLAWLFGQPPAAPAAAQDPMRQNVRPPLTRDLFAGAETCRSCHAGHARTVEASAHARTSQTASPTAIIAPFDTPPRIIRTSSPEVFYRMEAKDDGWYETAVIGSGALARTRTQRIDFAIGSGKQGQTYLWWRGSELLQLPLSYWSSLKTWAGNPGIPDRAADFTRPIAPRCLDCHATFVDVLPSPGSYDRSTMLLGVSCEKCHGPAAAHVAARRANGRPAAAGGDVVNPSRLTRDQKVDLCASCHGSQKLGPPFSFLPGDPVRRPSIAADSRPTRLDSQAATQGIDSHGQQATALMNSRCFQSSTMTCVTCHDPHADQRDESKLAERCLTCHKIEACGRFARDRQAIRGKCIDCHMPLESSALILSTNAAGVVQAKLRSHRIAVYADTR